jgi:hypothetical protein
MQLCISANTRQARQGLELERTDDITEIDAQHHPSGPNPSLICPNRAFLLPKRPPILLAAIGGQIRMKQAISSLIVVVGALLAAVPPALAHHSRAMFDMTQNVTYRGVVKEYRWQNPHSRIVITVGSDATDPATVGTWDVEASAISLMVSRGWNPTTFKPGDRITVVAHPSKDGSRLVLLFYAITADGTRLYRAQHRYPSETE